MEESQQPPPKKMGRPKGSKNKIQGILDNLEKDRGNKGRPPDRLTIDILPVGPLKNKNEQWLAIAKFMEINHERRQVYGMNEISIEEFCKRTKIEKSMVLTAENNQEFIATSLAMGKGTISIWLKSMLPNYMRAAERLAKTEENDKQYVGMMNSIIEMVNFKNVDLAKLAPPDEIDPEEVIREALKIVRRFDEETPIQRIIEKLAADSDADGQGGGLLDKALRPLNDIEAYTAAESDRFVGSVPEPSQGTLQSQKDNPIHGGEQDGQIRPTSGILSLVPSREAPNNPE